ncbi:P-loop NTPase fold protein [Azotobacter beijerinckii]|uniref:P-loop NTPase fold protein n=1 Tax=Azotobacter beijerinckii TaxID=170623 RepID=UPI0029536923|nr:P-loop NTPase fold protein [Azotobacter beijerinckii]MDV7211348.1 P-loop NTPase fold protein [Azotobacter beijerinckii]
MTLARCRQNFIDLIGDADNRVIALSGKWGTGKSHLWKEVQEETTDDKAKEAVYVSLFGVSSIAELKLKIAQGLLPKLAAGGTLAESIKNGCAGVKKVLKGIHSGFSALDELALIAAPMMIKGRFIVIDDIERKHDKLSIDEILGFIDDCVQSQGCRILLILNSDQLGDKKLWELFREKVIDQELRLDTSPSEAFDIATTLTPTACAAQVRPAVEACQITNIRIIRKIIRVVNHLLANRGQLPPDVLDRVIPSATLLSAIHYKGLEDGPDFDFVLNFNSMLVAMLACETKKRGEEETPEVKARERWRLLMDKLGIPGSDEFEALVVDYLKSGLIEGAAVGRIIDHYLAEGRELAARTRVHDFFERCIWHPEVPEAELLEELRAMLPDVGLLDMMLVTDLHEQAMRLTGGARLAQELIDGWLVAFRQRQRQRHRQGEELDLNFNYFRRPLHPDISNEISAAQARQQSTVTLLEVCRRVREDHGWGTREEILMKSVTPADYESVIRATTGADLKLLLLQSMDFLKNRGMYDSHFGGATQSFLDACQVIVQRDPDIRLSRLICNLFREAGMEPELTAPATFVAAGGAAAAGAAVKP